jgi:hypothetical protein
MVLAGVTVAEYLDVAAIRELEDPEIKLGAHQPEPEDVLVEVRQFPGAIGARAAPAKPCDLHTRQYQQQPGGAASTRIRTRGVGASAESKSYREHVLAACGELGESGQAIAVVFCALARTWGGRHRCLFLPQPIGRTED